VSLETLLVGWRTARLLADEPELLVVDKPPGIPIHGGDSELGEDVVTRLSQLLKARGSDDYLGIHQRLDKETSGVVLLTRRRELNARIAEQLETRAAEKVYLALVALQGGAALAREGVFLDHIEKRGDRMALSDRGGQKAVTRYRILAQNQQRALLELLPETGRTHQLRVQLAGRGAPIAGDRLYGGPPAVRLMLHARRLALPGLARTFEAPVPEEFDVWLNAREPTLGSSHGLVERLADAGCRRAPLARFSDAFRLVNDAADSLPGLVADRFGDHVALSVSSDEAVARRQEIAAALVALGVRGVYLKLRVRGDLRRLDVTELAPALPIAGVPAREAFVVREGAAQFWVRLGEGLGTGLFVDQRENRARVRALSAGARVLNLFCYTASFSVAAALGGAATTVNVDASAKALEYARDNFALNSIDCAGHRFVKADAVDWLRRAAKRGERFDLVILDPPSFATRSKGKTLRAAHYRELAQQAFTLLSPGGRLLSVTNHRATSQDELRQIVRDAARGARRRPLQVKDLPGGFDCPERFDGPFPSKSVLARVE
jgi:23S rRNA (cytosine1962-C5)-methyltransferase